MATDPAPALVTLARGWIGTPYLHQAAVKGVGCDCLGLLRGILAEHRGGAPIAVPPYDPSWDRGGEESLRDGLAAYAAAISLAALSPGDIALFRMREGAAARHCGVIAEKDGRLTLLHARQNARVSEDVFTAFWRARLAYAFRF